MFHLELKSDGLPGEFRVGPRAEMKGVGPIGPDWVLGYLADVSMALVGTFDNKLMWFSEAKGLLLGPSGPERLSERQRMGKSLQERDKG